MLSKTNRKKQGGSQKLEVLSYILFEWQSSLDFFDACLILAVVAPKHPLRCLM